MLTNAVQDVGPSKFDPGGQYSGPRILTSNIMDLFTSRFEKGPQVKVCIMLMLNS